MKSPLVIYHDKCADGFAAAWCAWLALPAETEFRPAQYGENSFLNALETVNDGIEDRDVFVLDFSFPKEDMYFLIASAKSVVWLDHHKTAFEMWLGKLPTNGFFAQTKNNCTTILDNNKSGALIAWSYFMPHQTVPRLLGHIDDYDRWQFKLRGTREINKAIWARTPWFFEQWSHNFEGNLEQLEVEGTAIQKAHMANIRSVVGGGTMKCHILQFAKEQDPKRKHWQTDFSVDAEGLALNCPAHLSSDAGHELATQCGTFGLLWRINKDGKCLCLLRSNGDYDVSAICKAFGGGGHKNAGGFEVTIQELLSWLLP
jgi:oligoribonuclease NrnB/cAMP/cGMP phosphodiesterase (DHH superfamily)